MFQLSRMAMCTTTLCSALVLCTLAPVQAQTTAVVAQTGDAAPDGNGTFSLFFGITLNNAGQVAFVGNLNGTTGGSDDNRGIFRGNGLTGPTRIVREGEISPAGSTPFSSTNSPAFNDAGLAAFEATVDTGPFGGSSTNEGIFRAEGVTGPLLVVRESQAAPNGEGFFSDAFFPSINSSGQVAFLGNLQFASNGASDGRAIYIFDEVTGLTQIVREGQSAPDGNGVISRIFTSTLNDAGQFGFRATLTDTGGGSSDDGGVFRADAITGVTRIAREGQAAPDGNGTFSGFFNPAFNNAGQAAFQAILTGTSGGFSDDNGIFIGDGVTGPTQIAREGQAAPDGNGAFASLGRRVALNDDGQALFAAELSGTSGGMGDDSGLFRGDGVTGPTQIVREGQTATDGNGTFSSFSSLDTNAIAINASGQVAFWASLDGTTSGSSDDEGIYFHDDALGLFEVVRLGNALSGSTVTSLSFSGATGNSGEERGGLNNLGQVALGYSLADGREGIAIWSLHDTTMLVGDYNGNGTVDAADYTIWADNFNAIVDPFAGADGNGDGVINAADYTIWADNFGTTAGIGTTLTIPEPGTFAFVLPGLLWAFKRRSHAV